jgi:hypothetical protein
MFQHPLYTPTGEFQRVKKLPANFSLPNEGWFVWEIDPNFAQYWQFRAEKKEFYTFSKSGKTFQTWGFYTKSALLHIENTGASAAEAWEIWQNSEPNYLQLRNPADGRCLYLLHEQETGLQIFNDLIFKPLAEIKNLNNALVQSQAKRELQTLRAHTNWGCAAHGILVVFLFFIPNTWFLTLGFLALCLSYFIIPPVLAYYKIRAQRELRNFETRHTYALEKNQAFSSQMGRHLGFGMVGLVALVLLFEYVFN